MFEESGRAITLSKKRTKSTDWDIYLMILGAIIMFCVPMALLGAYFEAEYDKLSFRWGTFLAPVALVVLFGLALFVIGLLIGKNRRTGNFQGYLNEHQRALTIALRKPRCPNCGNEMSEGNFEFCPFCGKPLKAQT